MKIYFLEKDGKFWNDHANTWNDKPTFFREDQLLDEKWNKRSSVRAGHRGGNTVKCFDIAEAEIANHHYKQTTCPKCGEVVEFLKGSTRAYCFNHDTKGCVCGSFKLKELEGK